MFRWFRPTSADATRVDPADDDDAGTFDANAAGSPNGVNDGRRSPIAPDLAALPIAGITRRRMAGVVGGLLAVWIIIVFTRQVGDAAAATTRAEEIAQGNQARQGQVAALERELQVIARGRYVDQQARGYGMGSDTEVAFSLAAGAPTLPDDAPGSAAVRVGADIHHVSPLERWLTVLFGPSD